MSRYQDSIGDVEPEVQADAPGAVTVARSGVTVARSGGVGGGLDVVPPVRGQVEAVPRPQRGRRPAPPQRRPRAGEGAVVHALEVQPRVPVVRVADREGAEALGRGGVEDEEVLAPADLEVDVVDLVVVRRGQRLGRPHEELRPQQRPEPALLAEQLQAAALLAVGPERAVQAAAAGLRAARVPGRALGERRLQVVAVRGVLARGPQERGEGHAQVLARAARRAPVRGRVPVGLVGDVVHVPVLLAGRPQHVQPRPFGHMLPKVLDVPLRHSRQQVQVLHHHWFPPADGVHCSPESRRVAAVHALQLPTGKPSLIPPPVGEAPLPFEHRRAIGPVTLRPLHALTSKARLVGQQAAASSHRKGC
mmetsp:Transcript_56055/g.163784  ORF Transcript_56055/g.163784 Transcript_56055/m.163784 type:complete len:363 (-) Transcript_56055:209-1297(-)